MSATHTAEPSEVSEPSPIQAQKALAPTPRWRKWMPWLGFLLLAWVLSRFDLSAIGQAFARVSTLTVSASLALFSANILLKSLRWQRMLAVQNLRLPTRVAIAAFLSSQFYGQVTLGRVGELYRAEALIERGVPLGLALSSSVYDRVLDLAAVLIVAATLSAFVVADTRAALVAGACMLLLGAMGLAVLRARWLAGLPPVAWFRRTLSARRGTRGLLGMLAQLVTGLGPLMQPRFLIEAVLWSAAAWLGYFGSLWVLADGMAVGATRTLLTAGASLGALSALLPVTLSGLGAREVIFMHVLGLQHVDGAKAVALSLLHLTVMTTSVLVLGLLGLAVRQRQQRASTPAR